MGSRAGRHLLRLHQRYYNKYPTCLCTKTRLYAGRVLDRSRAAKAINTVEFAFAMRTTMDTISTRLWKLPGELLRALINATAILVIVAAILALVAIARINNFAGNVAAVATQAALSKIDLPSRAVLANLGNLTKEVRALADNLREMNVRENPVLQSEIGKLREALTALRVNVDRLENARTTLIDEGIGQLARAVADRLAKRRDCVSNAGQVQLHGRLATTRSGHHG